MIALLPIIAESLPPAPQGSITFEGLGYIIAILSALCGAGLLKMVQKVHITKTDKDPATLENLKELEDRINDSIKELKSDIKDLHEKGNETNKAVFRVCGKIDMWFKTLPETKKP